MQVFVFILLVAVLGVFVYKQVQKTKADKLPTIQGTKESPNDKA